MKIRVVDIEGKLRPFVICEGCDEVIRAGRDAIVVRERVRGDVVDAAYHEGVCVQGVSFNQWTALGEWLSRIQNNSVRSE